MRVEFVAICLILTWFMLTIFINKDVFSIPGIILVPRIKFRENDGDSEGNPYFVEKFSHNLKNEEDMRSAVYLTLHRNFLQAISTKSVEVSGRKFTLNDICFKPHNSFFDEKLSKSFDFVDRLEIEARRLSPCLIMTPLNCFYDSVKIGSEISGWKFETDYLNRRLRDSYLIYSNSSEKPYVKSENGVELIEKWAELMGEFPMRNKEMGGISRWIKSMKLGENMKKICVDPLKSCEDDLDAESYFEKCGEKMRTKSGLKSSDEKILDCVENREEFVELIQEEEISKIMQFNQTNPEYENILSKFTCSGLYGTSLSTERLLEKPGSLKFEIVLMSYTMLTETLNEKAQINGLESNWNPDNSKEIILKWREMMRYEVSRFNSKKSSVLTNVVTKYENVEKEPKYTVEKVRRSLQFLVISIMIFLVIFGVLIWNCFPIHAIFAFIFRIILSLIVFCNVLADSQGSLVIEESFMYVASILIFLNLIITTRIHTIRRISKRKENKRGTRGSGSNISELSNYSSEVAKNWSKEKILKVLERYLKKEIGENEDSDKNIPGILLALWFLVLILFLPIFYVIPGSSEFLIGLAAFCIPCSLVGFIEYRIVCQICCKEIRHQRVVSAVRSSLTHEMELQEIGREQAIQNIESVSREFENVSRMSNFSEESDGNFFYYRITQRLRYLWISTYLVAISLKRSTAFLILLFVFGVLCMSLGIFAIPVRHSPVEIRSDELDFMVEIWNFSGRNFGVISEKMERIVNEIESCGPMIPVTKWPRVMGKGEDEFLKWFEVEKVAATIEAFEMKPKIFKKRSVVPSNFSFHLRYQLRNGESTEWSRVEIVEKIGEIIEEFNSNDVEMKVRPVGRMVVEFMKHIREWNRFVFRELVATLFFAPIVYVIMVNWVSIAPPSCAFLFTIFCVSCRLESAALVWVLFDESHYQLLTNFAFLIVIWLSASPFKELLIYKKRVEVEYGRCESQLDFVNRKKVAPLFCQLSDNLLALSAIFLAVGLLLVISLGWFGEFTKPIFAIMVILLVVMMNSYAVYIGSIQMIEKKIRDIVQEDLRGPDRIRRLVTRRKGNRGAPVLFEFDVERFSSRENRSDSLTEGSVEHEDESYEEEEDLMSDGEEDEEIVALMLELKQRWNKQAEEKEREEFLASVKESKATLAGIADLEGTITGRRETFLNLKAHRDERAGTSCSSSAPPQSEPCPSTQPHPYARYFPADFTTEMIDFVIDPRNRGGRPWVPAGHDPNMIDPNLAPPPVQIMDEEEELDEEVLEIVETSEDEGIGDVSD